MQPRSITRRVFLQWAIAPVLAFVPKPVPTAELRAGLAYSDSQGTPPAALIVLKDDDKLTEVLYPA